MNYRKLIVNRNINARRAYVWDEICEETAGAFVDKVDLLLSKGKDPIWVFIHSPGGSVSAAMAMIDEIEAAKAQGVVIKTCAMGLAHSAGALLLAMGSKGHRYVRPSTTVMLHPVSYGLGQDYAELQARAAQFFKKEAERINRMLSVACGRDGKKYSSFLKEINKGLWLSADAAVKYGVADAVWKGTLPIDEKDSEQRGVPEGSSQSKQLEHSTQCQPEVS